MTTLSVERNLLLSLSFFWEKKRGEENLICVASIVHDFVFSVITSLFRQMVSRRNDKFAVVKKRKGRE